MRCYIHGEKIYIPTYRTRINRIGILDIVNEKKKLRKQDFYMKL